MKPWFVRVFEALEVDRPAERRGSPRKPVSHIHANYFAGGGEQPYRVTDISLTGALIETPARWCVGTCMVIVFQVDPQSDGTPLETRAVQAKVARVVAGGIGIEFIFQDKTERVEFHRFLRQNRAVVPEN